MKLPNLDYVKTFLTSNMKLNLKYINLTGEKIHFKNENENNTQPY